MIRALSKEWAKAAEAKDAAKGASFYADRAFLLVPGATMASGKTAIRKAWSEMTAAPGFALTFAATKIEVCPSKEMAYEIGDYQLTMNDKEGAPQTSKGKYVVVWAKQAGKWKAVLDAPTTTQ